MNDGSFNGESPRNPGWKPRVERVHAQNPTSVSDHFLNSSRERSVSRVIQFEGRFLQVLGAGIIGYSSVISADLKTTIAGALVISAGRIAQRYFKYES